MILRADSAVSSRWKVTRSFEHMKRLTGMDWFRSLAVV